MNKIFGTYTRNKTEQKWHWKKECPDFPHSNIESMISTKAIPVHELCEHCLELDTPITNGISLLSAKADEYSEFIKSCFASPLQTPAAA